MINDSQVANYCIDAYTNFGIEPDRVNLKMSSWKDFQFTDSETDN